jgi:hypothetical protein
MIPPQPTRGESEESSMLQLNMASLLPLGSTVYFCPIPSGTRLQRGPSTIVSYFQGSFSSGE